VDSDSPGGSRWNQERLFPLVALALVVALVAGLLGISGYILLGRRGPGAVRVQAMTPEEAPSRTPWVPPTTVSPSATPTVQPTNTPVVVATPTSLTATPEGEGQLTPLPTPSLPTPIATGEAAGEAAGEVPATGLGVFASAGMGIALVGVLWGARGLRRRVRR